MSFVPSKKEPWLYSGYMIGNSIVFNNLFEKFPKIPIGMGQYPGANWRGGIPEDWQHVDLGPRQRPLNAF